MPGRGRQQGGASDGDGVPVTGSGGEGCGLAGERRGTGVGRLSSGLRVDFPNAEGPNCKSGDDVRTYGRLTILYSRDYNRKFISQQLFNAP